MARRPIIKNEASAEGTRSKKGVYWILGGLVVTGIAAVWNWVRGLPK
jgi:hypothetical protein